ncbi:RNA polymerase sigma factor SigM [Gimesia panareensis]|uniref:RNA polymerase sigma factor SigM n=1 Tax=Gimesia panareensis TaxID=2527978 RepID=A0A518FTU0_9PLAN|nr:sigma-70 family RNA polymerase sigma factor [Gimesia panareensis]QDV19767.1 RNA polymerase sigma factor SigM [Gimesia panareensis]
MDSSEGSISDLINAWTENESAAVERLQLEYFHRLRALARRVLNGFPAAAVEADDVVQSALISLCRFMRRPETPRDKDRNDLWRLLCQIVVYKSRQRMRSRTKGLPGGQERPMIDYESPEQAVKIEAALQHVSTNEFDLIVHDALDQLDEPLQRIAMLMMEGYTQTEMATRLGCSRRTIIRKMNLLKQLLAVLLEED